MGRAEPCLLLAAVLASACTPLRPDRPISPPLASAPAKSPVRAAPGESACALAGRVGVDPRALLAANGLEQPPERPLRKDPLELPAGAGLRHRVQAGETLDALARWYGHPISLLAGRNGIADPDRVVAGRWLVIPAGARTGCPPAAPSVAPVPVRVAPAEVAPSATRATASTAPAVPPPKPEPGAHGGELWLADDLLGEARERYDAADFEAVLELTQAARRVLPEQADAASAERRARATWLAGLAHAGLDRRDEAIAALREALRLRPSLRNDPSLSPRILGLLDEKVTPPGPGAR